MLPADDPYNDRLINGTLEKRREFERTLELQKLYLPKEIVQEVKQVCIAITGVAVFYKSAREWKGTSERKDAYEKLQKSQEELKEKMDLLENHLQKLIW